MDVNIKVYHKKMPKNRKMHAFFVAEDVGLLFDGAMHRLWGEFTDRGDEVSISPKMRYSVCNITRNLSFVLDRYQNLSTKNRNAIIARMTYGEFAKDAVLHDMPVGTYKRILMLGMWSDSLDFLDIWFLLSSLNIGYNLVLYDAY